MIKLPPSSTHQYLRPPGLASLPESQEKAAGHIRGLPDHCRAGGGHNVGGGVPGLNSPPRPEGHREGGSLRAGVGALSRNCCRGGGDTAPANPSCCPACYLQPPGWRRQAVEQGVGAGVTSRQPLVGWAWVPHQVMTGPCLSGAPGLLRGGLAAPTWTRPALWPWVMAA